MKKHLHVAALGLWLAAHGVHAEDAQAIQQNKMVTCNKQAEGMKGDERKTKMSECLSAKPMDDKAHKGGTQQEKMKRCNAEAKGLKGDERKMKMSACLKG